MNKILKMKTKIDSKLFVFAHRVKLGLCLLLGVWAFSACKDDFDVEKLQTSSRLVVYSFPTEGDTTLVAVTKSLPVASFKGDRYVQSQQVVDAHIVYKVNGVELPVKRIRNIDEAKHLAVNNNKEFLALLVGQYYVVGKQKEGDDISVQVSADGYSTVSASTYIPKKVSVQLGDIRFDEKNSDPDSYQNVDKLEATFKDDVSTQDYYSVMVKLRQKQGTAMGVRIWNDGYREYKDTCYVDHANEYFTSSDNQFVFNFDSLSWVIRDIEVSTMGEPLLNKKTKLNDDFGFDDYSFFGNSYIFNDRTINGQLYTLHLEALSADMHANNYNDYGTWDWVFGYDYIVELYSMTPVYYRFLKSINDAQGNDWIDAGLMQVTPTYSNVKGGFGVVAGYNASSSSRHFKPSYQGGDDIYTK